MLLLPIWNAERASRIIASKENSKCGESRPRKFRRSAAHITTHPQIYLTVTNYFRLGEVKVSQYRDGLRHKSLKEERSTNASSVVPQLRVSSHDCLVLQLALAQNSSIKSLTVVYQSSCMSQGMSLSLTSKQKK